MFLQNDKPTLDFARERASGILYGEQPVSMGAREPVSFGFSHDHSTAKFDELVQARYPEAAAPTQETGFDKYCVQEVPTYVAPVEPVQKYFNDSNPVPAQPAIVPYQSFRPKILEEFEGYQAPMGVNPPIFGATFDGSGMDEMKDLDNAGKEISLTKVEMADAPVEIERKASPSATESYIKLNAKGLIACVTFIAVTALVVLLVIINSFAIGSAGARIDRLRDGNADLAIEHSRAMDNRQSAWNNGVARATGASDTSSPDHVYNLPPLDMSAPTSGSSTNWFDQLARFFGNLFT
jgi:hypothetical protein